MSTWLWHAKAAHKDWQYFTYFVGKKKVERQKKRHKSHQHASRGLAEPLQEPRFGLTCDFNMFFFAACVRELLEINQKRSVSVKGEGVLFQNEFCSFVKAATLQSSASCFGPKLAHYKQTPAWRRKQLL